MKTKCSVCGILKQKIKTTKRYGDRFVCVDENGKTWRGNRCRDCITKQSKKLEEVELTTRKCGICKSLLPISRRFNCKECVKPEDYSLEYDNCVYYVAATN